MPDRMGYSVIFMFKRSYFFSWTVWFPFPWSSWCALSELMMWVRSNSTWQNKSEDVKSSLFPVSPVSKQMSFHPSEKLVSRGFRLLDLVKLRGFLHMEIVLGFVCVGIYVLLFLHGSARDPQGDILRRDYSVLATHSFLPFLSPSSKTPGHGIRQRGSTWKGFCFVQGSYDVRRTSM